MNDPLDAVPELLAKAKRPGDFYTTGQVSAPLPLIEVEGVGPLAFPVLDHQARELLAAAEPAPYGRGEQTIVDPAVRRAGQIAPERLTIDAEAWQPVLDTITQNIKRALGVPGEIEAQLYKLLVYGPGDFFAEHRDTEKAPGMFATLVVLLPARWSGGALVIRHGGREATLDIGGPSPSTISYAAFYTDCLHELRPIADGHRVALVYNVCRSTKRRLAPPDHEPLVQAVAERLGAWLDEGYPTKALFPLEHQYTPAALSFDGLKGRDQAVVQVLHAAAQRVGCATHLAIVSKYEFGCAAVTWRPGRWSRWGHDDETEFEAVEPLDWSLSITHWRRPDGAGIDFGELRFEEDELFPSSALEGIEPDEESFHEATGNEGASYERTYRRAVVALWPQSAFAQVWAAAEPGEAVDTLRALTDAGDPRATDFAAALIARWPPTDNWRGGRDAAQFVSALAALEDRDIAETFARKRLARFAITEDMAPSLATLIATCSADVIRETVIPAAASRTPLDGTPWPVALAELLDQRALDDETARALAAAITAHLPTERIRDYSREPNIGPSLVTGLVRALVDLDEPGLTIRALGHIEVHADIFDPDAVLVPAALHLADAFDGQKRQHIAFVALVEQCLEHLDARIAEPLDDPETWCQTVDLQCDCRLCIDFAAFLAADQQVWKCKVAKAGRRHLYGQVSLHKLDVDARTIRKGSPLTWEATKNRKSHEARLEQRTHDLEHRGRLGTSGGCPKSGPLPISEGLWPLRRDQSR